MLHPTLMQNKKKTTKKQTKKTIFEVLWITFGDKFLVFIPYDYILSEIGGLGPNFNSWAIQKSQKT